MTVLYYIVLASLVGGLLSLAAAALVAFSARPALVPVLVSYAIGALLGAAFLEILPHALEESGSTATVSATLLAGILAFFLLEKLVLWRHCHTDVCEAHTPDPASHDHGRSGLMITVGDTFHNFVDGIIIAAAFLNSIPLGVITALAIIAHEIPQEVGDFLILLHSGYSKAQAFALNLLSSLATVLGGVLAWLALEAVREWVPYALALAASSMIYVAVADLIPGLHRRPELGATVQQVLLIALGIASISGVEWLVGSIG
jgi:zinc and cadmium transporter